MRTVVTFTRVPEDGKCRCLRPFNQAPDSLIGRKRTGLKLTRDPPVAGLFVDPFSHDCGVITANEEAEMVELMQEIKRLTNCLHHSIVLAVQVRAKLRVYLCGVAGSCAC